MARILPAVAAALALTAARAGAAGEPSVFAAATLGSLTVTSGVLVSPASVDMRGVWTDTKRACSATRRLTVKALVDYVDRAGRTHRLTLTNRFADANCAEGGPNVGFTLSARQVALACPSGAWKPGRYDFVTTTTEPVTKLKAIASVGWNKSGRC
ncbi:MAG TPA: hypothetical protein VFA44_08935 [Gaiellaceae bacterium]|nr:hypothetical protein [Gaiellaceae bacterium]